MLISICIATYQRPQLLIKLLDSISELELPDNINIEIIIVDNDADLSAKEVIKEYLDRSKLNLFYFDQPIKNISITRNLAVSKANGELIAFIDDDEIASNMWILELYQTLIRYNADGVFGKVTSYFLPSTPEWITSCYLYNRPIFKTGTIASITRSGNCLIKKTILNTVDGPFEPEYGITGGSDTKLFNLLILKGAKFINSNEAETFEFVPPDRANLRWLIARAFRTSNGYVRRSIELEKGNKLSLRIKFFFIGIIFSFISLVLSIFFIMNKQKRIHWFLKMVGNSGKLLAVFNLYPSKYY